MATFSSIVVPTGAKATGRRTFIDIIDELSRPINAADETVRAMAADSFRAAVRTMNRKGMWPWEIQEEDVIITKDQIHSSVQSAIKKPLSMHLLNAQGGTEDQPVSYSPYDEFLERYSMDFSSMAWHYTIPNLFETGQIRWAPIPSANDFARFAYYRVTPAPRNEQEAIEIPDYATEAYMGYAWEEFLMRVPAAKSTLDTALVVRKSNASFREISAHVNAPGDMNRATASRLTRT